MFLCILMYVESAGAVEVRRKLMFGGGGMRIWQGGRGQPAEQCGIKNAWRGAKRAE